MTGTQPPVEDCDPADIERRVIEIVGRQFVSGDDVDDDGRITRETRFREDLDADSLDFIELTMEAEDEFEITITDAEAEKVNTVGDAFNLVMEIVSR